VERHSGEDILTCDETDSLGEGALLLVNLSNNRQLQGNPELAGAEMVRQLQKISRLMERSKKDQRENRAVETISHLSKRDSQPPENGNGGKNRAN
jgi:hypothetical protein